MKPNKIKITKEIKEFEGTTEKGFVKPFGTSAHISIGKKHFGKEVIVVIPSEPKYCWILSDLEKDKLIKVAKNIIQKKGGRMEHYYFECLEDLKKTIFSLNSLIKLTLLVQEERTERKLTEKIRKFYSF